MIDKAEFRKIVNNCYNSVLRDTIDALAKENKEVVCMKKCKDKRKK